MSDRQHNGLEVHVRNRVERNSKSFNREHTVSVTGRMEAVGDAQGRITFVIAIDGGEAQLGEILDALHQEANAANRREIERQQREQLAAIQAGA